MEVAKENFKCLLKLSSVNKNKYAHDEQKLGTASREIKNDWKKSELITQYFKKKKNPVWT